MQIIIGIVSERERRRRRRITINSFVLNLGYEYVIQCGNSIFICIPLLIHFNLNAYVMQAMFYW